MNQIHYSNVSLGCATVATVLLCVGFFFGMPAALAYLASVACMLSVGFRLVQGKYQLGFVFAAVLALFGLGQIAAGLHAFGSVCTFLVAGLFGGLQYVERRFRKHRILDQIQEMN